MEWSMLGVLGAVLIVAAGRVPIVAWIALAPIGVAALHSPLHAALAGGIAGACAGAASVWDRTMRPLVPRAAGMGVVGWALAFGGAAWLVVDRQWIIVALPAAYVLAVMPLRLAGAPRWITNPLACSQERWLVVVHTARLGGDLVTGAVLAMASATIALWLVAGELLPAVFIGAAIVLAMLAFGAMSLRAAIRRSDGSPRLRVAAVVADGEPPASGELNGLWPIQSPEYRNVAATVERYQPLIERAAAEGARVVVLPEVGVCVDATTWASWAEAVSRWAKAYELAVVAPFFNDAVPKNELVVVDTTGLASHYEKQHPAPGLEPPREARTPPGPHLVRAGGDAMALSTVICVDLDYGDLVGPVRAAGGFLAAPANDWLGSFAELHCRTSVWAAVMSGVAVVRATGHGISAIFDGAGRMLASKSSDRGPVLLLSDVPLAAPTVTRSSTTIPARLRLTS